MLDRVDHCYALHLNNIIYPGTIKLDSGPVTAISNRFVINIKGKSSHCMIPNAGIDANFIGCSLVGQLYGLTGMMVPPL